MDFLRSTMFSALGSIFGKNKPQGDQVAVRESQVGDFVVYGNVAEESRAPDYSRLPYPGGPLYPPLAQLEHMQGAAAGSSGDKGSAAAHSGFLDGVPFVLGAAASGTYQGSRDPKQIIFAVACEHFVSDARKVTEKKAAADAQRQEEAAHKAAGAAVFDDQSKCFQLIELVQNYPWLYGKLRRDNKDNPKRENASKEIARLLGIVRCSILVFKLLPRCWVDREAKGCRLLLNRLLARDVRQMADVVLINPHPFFLNREKAPKREYFAADGYHIHRILGVRKMSKLIKLHVRKKL
ncbi:hypothetical protein HPB47_012010 [Ixodes persulcatus]|uniref:Uncharacterized protein n=1 Tax=Ixodes persulcatus TaxID=34615 RepID=A0AC60NUN0_IXOPE|nr:hypothetical protein HPB47_012010 [Ixodes persulcatus]